MEARQYILQWLGFTEWREMEMRNFILVCTLLLLCFDAEAANLKASSVVCEQANQLELLAQPFLKNKPGNEVEKEIIKAIKFNELMVKFETAVVNEANKEQAIRDAANMRGNSSARAEEADAKRSEARREIEQYQSFLRHCMVIKKAVPARILKHLPISGRTQIEMPIHGADAQVWTVDYYLDEDSI